MDRSWRSTTLVLPLAVAVFVLGWAGCNGRLADEPPGNNPGSIGPTPISTPTPPSVDSGASAPPDGPYQVTCTIFSRDLARRPVPEAASNEIVLRTDQDSAATIQVGDGIDVRAKLSTSSDSNNDILTVAFARSNVSFEYELPRVRMPPFTFVGGHGFSGLNYVITPDSSYDVQFICEASPLGVRPATAEHPSSSEPPTPPPNVPVRIDCEASWTGPQGTQTEHVMITNNLERTITFGSHAIQISYSEGDPYERVRVLVLLVLPDPRSPGFRLQQLFQTDPTRPLSNNLEGVGALTGRATWHANDDVDGGVDDLSIACASR